MQLGIYVIMYFDNELCEYIVKLISFTVLFAASEDADQPVITSFSDDEPLVVA